MLSNQWPRCRRIDRQIGLFLLLLIEKVVTKDVEPTGSSEEVNFDIALDEPGFGEENDNVAANESVPFRSLLYKSPVLFRSLLIRHGVIPDVLAIAPSYLTEVVYSLRCVVSIGERIDPVKLQNEPRKIVWPWQDDSFYTLVFVDADVPSRQNRSSSQRLHWLVINIPAYHLKRGDPVVEYIGPIVPRKTGMHRYVFAVFKQHDRLDYEGKRIKSPSNKLSKDRRNFSIRDFATKYKLGDPISMNFYLSGWPLDQYVPEFPFKRPQNSSSKPSVASTDQIGVTAH